MSAEKEQHIQKYKTALADPDGCEYYCATLGDELIGLVTINKNMDDNFWAIYLTEEFWGKGYAKELLDFAITELKRAGHKKDSYVRKCSKLSSMFIIHICTNEH